MNQIMLSKMEIRNFKGIKEFTLNIENYDASIYGDNGVGKTTLNDAFLWVLFGKDSANRADFAVKPQGKDGNDVHYLETDVTLGLSINGQARTFRKMLTEKWTKRRGAETEEFTGHETSHWVDLVPVKKKEFLEAISSIINETVFKLLTNPFFFCTQALFKWEDRRKILMEICGDVTDAEVIAADESLAKLTAILSGKTIDNHKKIIAEKMKRLNHDIDEVPVKINELSRTLLGEEVDYTLVEQTKAHLENRLKHIEEGMADANKIASRYQLKQQETFKLTTAMDARRKVLDDNSMAGLNRAMEEKAKLAGTKYSLTTETATLKRKLATELEEAESVQARLGELRKEWKEEYAKNFTEPDQANFVCPTCEQPLPDEKRQEKIDKMLSNFEANKARTLQSNKRNGKELAERSKLLNSTLEETALLIKGKETELWQAAARITELDEEIENQRASTFSANYAADPEYAELKIKHQALMDELNRPIKDLSADLLEEKKGINAELQTINKTLALRDIRTTTAARIDELKAEERTLSSQRSELEKEQFLIEKFMKSKVDMLEENINSRFKLVKWKMLKININGGLEELCEAMVEGISFNSNLNHAARVNAGLDIINVLAEHYGISAPIFIDFRESVSKIIDTGSQIINLIKSEPDKVLRVEVA